MWISCDFQQSIYGENMLPQGSGLCFSAISTSDGKHAEVRMCLEHV